MFVGFGKSAKPNNYQSIYELSESLVAFLNTAGIQKVCLLGNSLGCQIIAHVAAHHPNRVDRIFMQGTGLFLLIN